MHMPNDERTEHRTELMNDDDVTGYLVVIAIIAIHIGLLLPAVQKERPAGNLPAVSAGVASGVRQ